MISKTNLTALALMLVIAFASINTSQAFDQPSVGPNAPAWDGDFQTNILGNNNDSNKFSSANVVENADGSILERLQFIQSKLTANPVFDDKFTIANDPDNQASVFQFLTTQITEGAESFKQAILKIGSNESSLKNALTISSDVNDTIKVGVGITDTPTATLDVDGSIKLRGVSCPTDTNGNKLTVDGSGNVVCSKDVSVVGADPEVSTLDNVVANNAGVIEGLASSTSNGTDLRIKSLEAGTNIALTADNDTVTITNTFSEDDPKVGSLNSNMIPKWDGSTLVDSTISTDGSDISIIDSSPGVIASITADGGDGASDGGSAINLKSEGIVEWSILQRNQGVEPNSLHFTTGQNNIALSKLTVTKDGNIGIGTISPLGYGAYGLEISTSDPVIRFNDSDGEPNNSNYEIRAIGSAGYEGMQFRKVNDANDTFTDLLFIQEDGNVGIGDSGPKGARLVVGGGLNSGGLKITSNIPDQTLDSVTGLVMDNYQGSSRIYSKGVDTETNGTFSFTVMESDGGGKIKALSVDGDGKIGMGFTDPANKLSVNGQVSIGGNESLGSSWYGSVSVGSDGYDKVVAGPLSSVGAVIGAHSSDLGAWAPLVIGGSTISIKPNSVEEGIYVDANSDVGIGTTSLSGKLSIADVSAGKAAIHLKGNLVDSANILEIDIDRDYGSGYSNNKYWGVTASGVDGDSITWTSYLGDKNGAAASRFIFGNNISYQQNDSTKFFITSSGNSKFDTSDTYNSSYSWTNSALMTNSIEIMDREGGTVSDSVYPTLSLHDYGAGGSQFTHEGSTKILHLASASGGSAGTLSTGSAYFSKMKIHGGLEVTGTPSKPGGGTWADSSDERLKQNIEKIDSSFALDKISQLEGVTYQWINPDQHKDGVVAGLTAQNLESVFPEWVTELAPEGDDLQLIPDGDSVKGIQFPHGFNGYLIEAIKELKKQNEGLSTKNNLLEQRIEALEAN